jgi:acetyl-CoA carboxylase biotin carboxyl carrier protein
VKLPDVNVLQRLVALVESNQLEELTVESGAAAVTVRRTVEVPRAVASVSAALEPVLTSTAEPATPAEDRRNLVHITSPIIGVFYRAPDPTSGPYVTVGTMVEEGTVVGLVEAMKVFNEIVAEVRGRVVELPAANEQLVSRGETLVIIDPLG